MADARRLLPAAGPGGIPAAVPARRTARCAPPPQAAAAGRTKPRATAQES